MVKKCLKVLKTIIKFALVICAVLAGIALWQNKSVEDIKEDLRRRGI